MNVTTLVVDDEPVARAGLRDMLAEVSWITCIGEASSGPAAVDAIDRLRPELVFLDVQMPGLLGTDVLAVVRHRPLVVFTTAYGEHAVTAFELGALDYLLKPFGPERLLTTLERVRAAIGEPSAAGAIDRLREAFRSGPMSRLFVRRGGAVVPLPVSDVAWFEAEGDYVVAHAAGATHVVHVPLQRLEARLDPGRFVRIHRARVVNLDHVAAFRRAGAGQLVAELRDGTRLAVSRARSRELRGLAV